MNTVIYTPFRHKLWNCEMRIFTYTGISSLLESPFYDLLQATNWFISEEKPIRIKTLCLRYRIGSASITTNVSVIWWNILKWAFILSNSFERSETIRRILEVDVVGKFETKMCFIRRTNRYYPVICWGPFCSKQPIFSYFGVFCEISQVFKWRVELLCHEVDGWNFYWHEVLTVSSPSEARC